MCIMLQPWMQTRSAFYALGGMIPPSVAEGGIAVPLMVSGVCCLSTIVGGLFDIIYTSTFAAAPKQKSGRDVMSEETPLVSARDRGRSRGPSYAPAPSSGGYMETIMEHASAPHMESDELSVLQRIIAASSNPTIQLPEGSQAAIGDIVGTVLDATPYCSITEEERNDPNFLG